MIGLTTAILFALSMCSLMGSIWSSSASTALFRRQRGLSYHPSALLKLYIYGYLNRIQSSRRLEREAGRNLEVLWLLRRLTPDDKTNANFCKDNGQAIKKVCAQFVMLSEDGFAQLRERCHRR
jgi:transposase